MTEPRNLDPHIIAAIEKIEAFVAQTTGKAPTAMEMADALTRYFVLKEIADFVMLSRNENEPAPSAG